MNLGTLLGHKLEELCGEMTADKNTVRHKAFADMSDIILNRSDELVELLNAAGRKPLNWITLFKAASKGIQIQFQRMTEAAPSALKTLQNKNPIYQDVLLKVVAKANRMYNHVPLKEVFAVCLNAIENPEVILVFGTTYLQLLDQQIFKNVTPMKGISKKDYSRMVDAIFILYDDNQNVPDSQFYSALLRVIDVGIKNFELGFCLESKLKSLVQFLQSNTPRKFHNDLFHVYNLVVHTLAVENAESVMILLTVANPIIFKKFSSRQTDKETKECIFEILNLSIILQCPSPTLNLVKDNAKWGTLMRGAVNLIDLELEMLDKQHNVYIQATSLSPIFVEFAARTTSHAFFDQDIWKNQREDDGQDEKRKKHLMKIDAFMDRIRLPNRKFSHRWILILGRALDLNSTLLTPDDHTVLLNFLCEFQGTIQTIDELSSFYLLCEVLMNFERRQKLKLTAKQLQTWNDITLATFRWCAGNNTKINNECHGLLSLLIENKKFPSKTFILPTLQAYLAGTIKKTDNSIQTLIITLLSFNINLLSEPQSIVKDLISNLFSLNPRNINMLMSTGGRPHEKLESIVFVLCTIWTNLYKDGFTDNILQYLKTYIFTPSETHYKSNMEYVKYNKKIEDLTQLILISHFKNPLVEKFRPSEWNSNAKKTLPNNILYTIDEEMFGHFLKEYQASESMKKPSETDSIELCELLLDKLHRCCLLANMLNAYIEMGCLNKTLFKGFQICKRIALIFQETEKIFPQINVSNVSTKLCHDLLNMLENIFHTRYHEPVARFIRSHDLRAMLEWLKHCLLRRSLIVGQSEQFEKLLPNDLPSNIMLNHRALKVLALYLVYEGQHMEEVAILFGEDEGPDINCEHITDVGLFLGIAKVLAKCRYRSEVIKSFVQDTLNEIVTIHHPNAIVMDKVVEIVPDLLEFLMVFEDNNIAHDVIILITAVGNYAKNNFPASTIKAILNTVKHFNKNFPYCFDMKGARENTVYEVTASFLLKTSFEIQVATAQQIVLIFHRDWTVARQISRQKDLNNFQATLLKFFVKAVDDMKLMNEYQVNLQKNLLIQMFCFMLCGNFFLRDKIEFMLLELLVPERADFAPIQTFFSMLKDITSYSVQSIIESNLHTLIGYWFKQGHPLQSFPWYLTEAKSEQEFFFNNAASLTVGVVEISLKAISTVAAITQRQDKELLLLTAPALMAAIVPCAANINQPEAEKGNLLKLKDIIVNQPVLVISVTSSIYTVIGMLLSKVYDHEKAVEYFGQNHAVYPCETTLNHKDFLLCLNTLSTLIDIKPESNSQGLLPRLCCVHPNQVQRLLFTIEYDLEIATAPEYMLLKLFQFALCMDEIKMFLRQPSDENVKRFIIKNCIHFVCNQIVNSDGDLLRSLISYLKYFCLAYMPIDLNLFQTELPFVINSLVQKFIELETESNTEQDKILEIVKLFLIDNVELFKDAIKLLPEMPDHPKLTGLNLSNVQAMDTDAVDLMNEIQQFNKMEFISSESLNSLAYNLGMCKNQLVEMYIEAHEIQFSNESLDSCLHQLVSKLLILLQSDSDTKRSRLAAKCLGELGASDLRIGALYSQKDLEFYKGHINLQDCYIEFYTVIMRKLPEALMDSRSSVKLSASTIATLLVQTNIGRQLIESFPQLQIFCLPAEPKYAVFFNEPARLDRLDQIFVKDYKRTFHTWIIDTCTSLLTVINESCLQELLKYDVDFAKDLFPALIQLYLAFNKEAVNKKLECEVSKFFAKFYETVCDAKSPENRGIFCDKEIIRSMLNLVECNRLQYNETFYGRHICNPKLILDYKHIIKAAVYCEAHFTAILYGELWAFSKTPDEGICLDVKASAELCETLQISYNAVRATDISDYLIDPIEQRKHYLMSRNMYSKVLQEMTADSDLSEISNVLMRNGFHRIAHTMNRFDAFTKYETSWKLCDWSVIDELVETDSNENLKIEFEKNHYGALKQFHRDDELSVHSFIQKARDVVIKMLKNTAIETPESLYGFFGMLNRLQQIEDACKVRFQRQEPTEMLTKWENSDLLPATEFKWTELKFSQRICLLRGAGVRAHRTWVPNVLQETIANLITCASNNNFEGVATSNIALLKELKLCQDYAKILLIDADISYKQGAMDLAKQALKQAINDGNNIVKMIAYRKLGEFSIDDTFYDSPHKVFQTFFGESIKLLNHYAKRNDRLEDMERGIFANDDVGRNIKNGICIFEKVAKFYDNEYVKASTYMKSLQFMQRKNLVQRQKYAVDDLDKKIRKERATKDEYRLFKQLFTNYGIDAKELEQIESDRNSYAGESLKYYIQHAKVSDKGHLSIFRIISLWLSNKKIDAVREEIISKSGLLSIPTHVFLTLIPQLCARLTNTKTTYVEETIYKILFKCTIDHPHHTLTHIMALAKSHDDLLCLKSSQSQPSQEPRVLGANQMLKDLTKSSTDLALCIKQFDKMSTMLIKFAYREVNMNSAVDCRNEAIMKLSNLTHVHCPTASLPVSLDGKYSDIISIVKWEPTIEMVGGINAPKKMVCVCSDGQKRIQLLKGNDDIRQDAVMQQVFNMMNLFLKNDSDANERKLNVKTYKVIPFSRRSGMLEWCDNTAPLGQILQNLHIKCRPYGMELKTARSIMDRHRNEKESSKKLVAFQAICKDVRPVFQHFLLRGCKVPGSWFERKQAYVNSVATTSIVGYILGIGDRHVNNILVDKRSSELVHIDFGIAFDAGKSLATPETIPFRLTREIVAAMGITGIEGTFKNSSRITMKILRENQTTILAILECLLYDPLYTWTLTIEKARRTQSLEYDPNIVDEDRNTSAERALQCVLGKLNGRESEWSGQTSIEGQIDRLIQQATHDFNLCRLFPGWQPYL